MTVAELIKRLQEIEPDFEVIDGYWMEPYESSDFWVNEKDGKVYL